MIVAEVEEKSIPIEKLELGEPVEAVVLTKEKKKKDKKKDKKDKKDEKKKGKKKFSVVVTREDLDPEKLNPVSNPDFVDPSKEEKWIISTTKESPPIIEKKLHSSVSPITPTERQGFMDTKYFPSEGYTHLDPSKSDNLYSAFNQLQKKTGQSQPKTTQQRPTHLKDGIQILMYARASWSYNAQVQKAAVVCLFI